jgi:hypothetical protein
MTPGAVQAMSDQPQTADLAQLRERAARYRRLAKAIYNREFETKVEALARECESAASDLEDDEPRD